MNPKNWYMGAKRFLQEIFGDYVPDGWKLIDRLFVDKLGFSDGGAALSIDQFIAKVKSGFGYAIIEEGQFQLYIGVFERV